MKHYLLIILLLIIRNNLVSAQADYLSVDDAIQIALKNNYNIQLAKNDIEIAENNTSNFNTGVLPTVTGNASVLFDYNRQGVKIGDMKQSQRGNSFPIAGGVAVNYVLFSRTRGLNIQQLNEFYNLSDLQLRQSIETLLANLYVNYYRVTTLERNIEIQKANLEISKRNLLRAEYAFEYGVSTRLGILNSEVNVNNDSIAVQNAILDFENAQRDFNILLGKEPLGKFTTDTTINFISDLNVDVLLVDTKEKNIQLQLAEQNISIETLNKEIAKSNWLPTINAQGAYNWNQTFFINNPANINLNMIGEDIRYFENDGFNGGLAVAWNIFDGGRTKVQVQNANIAIENTQLFKEDIWRQLQRDIYNNWNAYSTALLIVATQEKNIETSERNFERTAEQFKLGNISTTTYREAQTNLLNAQLSYLNSLYNAKVLETTLLQLSGNLVAD